MHAGETLQDGHGGCSQLPRQPTERARAGEEPLQRCGVCSLSQQFAIIGFEAGSASGAKTKNCREVRIVLCCAGRAAGHWRDAWQHLTR